MDGAVVWYRSRTIVTALIGAVFGLLATTNILPSWLDQKSVVEIVLVVGGLIVAHGRATSTKQVVATKAKAEVVNAHVSDAVDAAVVKAESEIPDKYRNLVPADIVSKGIADRLKPK